jgi:hypothetical protein
MYMRTSVATDLQTVAAGRRKAKDEQHVTEEENEVAAVVVVHDGGDDEDGEVHNGQHNHADKLHSKHQEDGQLEQRLTELAAPLNEQRLCDASHENEHEYSKLKVLSHDAGVHADEEESSHGDEDGADGHDAQAPRANERLDCHVRDGQKDDDADDEHGELHTTRDTQTHTRVKHLKRSAAHAARDVISPSSNYLERLLHKHSLRVLLLQRAVPDEPRRNARNMHV